MMSSSILITGGSRSGKSSFALQMAERCNVPRYFLATCPYTDSEINERILRHQKEREGRGWHTVEETLFLGEQITRCPKDSTILIDCLTLWINNLMYDAEEKNEQFTEDHLAELVNELGHTAKMHDGTVIMVTNEVGLGVVPGNTMARVYRDLVGRCNQILAAQADQVFLVSCGLSLQLK